MAAWRTRTRARSRANAPIDDAVNLTNGAETRTESTNGRKCDDAFPWRYTVAIGTSTIRCPARREASSAFISYSKRSPGTAASQPSSDAG